DYMLDKQLLAERNGPNAPKTVDGILQVFHELLPESAPHSSESYPSTSDLTELAGHYVLTTPRNQLLYPVTELFTAGISVHSANGNLAVSSGINGGKSQLTQTGANHFSPSGQTNQYQYVFDDSGGTLYTSLGFRYEKVPFALIALLAVLLAASLVVMCLTQISLLIQLFNLVRKQGNLRNPQLTLAVGSSIFLCGCGLYLLSGTIPAIHELQLLTVGLWICTILFPILTVLGIVQAITYKFKNLSQKIWTISTAVLMTVMACYLIYWGFFGFAIWKY
ncbi:MAG: hypothetical protein AAF399_02015, partial [Bacteroidota bacterium]